MARLAKFKKTEFTFVNEYTLKKILETNHILLREFVPKDLEALYQLDSDPEVMKYIGLPRSKEVVKENLKKMRAYYKNHPGLGVWAAIERKSNHFIGWF